MVLMKLCNCYVCIEMKYSFNPKILFNYCNIFLISLIAIMYSVNLNRICFYVCYVCLFCCYVTTDTCRLSCARRKVSPLVTLFFSPLFRHFYNGKLTLHMLYFCVMNNVLRILCVAEELKI